MKHFTAAQKKELKQLASNWRRNKISMQEYHNSLTKYYN